MSLNIKQLRSIVDETVKKKDLERDLKIALVSALGHSVDIKAPINEIARRANDRLEQLTRSNTGPKQPVDVKLLLNLTEHPSAEVRKTVASLLPVNHVGRLLLDEDRAVRLIAMQRSPLKLAVMAAARFSDDEVLTETVKNRIPPLQDIDAPRLNRVSKRTGNKIRTLREAMSLDVQETMPTPDENEPLGDAVKQSDVPELSEAFYESLAFKFVQDYDVKVIESNWRGTAVKRYASSVKATSGVVIDEKKLRDAIDELIKDRESVIIKKDALQETIDNLSSVGSLSTFPIIEEALPDPVRDLINSNVNKNAYVQECMKLFSIRESSLPPAFRKFRLGEGNAHYMTVPVKGSTPGQRVITEIDERALDLFVKNWNDRQVMLGEPVRIEWSLGSMHEGSITFNVELR